METQYFMLMIFTGLTILFIFFMVALKFKGSRVKAQLYPYIHSAGLFSPAERSFYGVLSLLIDNQFQILGKVRVADVVTPQKGLSRSAWQTAFNKISSKHFDFLLCRTTDLSVVCAIELDDRSHQSVKRQQRDEFLNGVCGAAGIPILHIPAQASYHVEEVKSLLAFHAPLKSDQ